MTCYYANRIVRMGGNLVITDFSQNYLLFRFYFQLLLSNGRSDRQHLAKYSFHRCCNTLRGELTVVKALVKLSKLDLASFKKVFCTHLKCQYLLNGKKNIWPAILNSQISKWLGCILT